MKTNLRPSLIVVLGAAVSASCTDHSVVAPAVRDPLLSQGAAAASLLQTANLFRFDDLSEVPGASASLLRTGSGLRFTIHTADLTPGDALTIWWVVFNSPENCQHPQGDLMQCSQPDLFDEAVAATVLFAAGHVVGGSGRGNFAGSLRAGDVAGCQPPFGEFGLCRGGLLQPETAETHLVVRGHGQSLPKLVSDQIRTFAGGCTPETSFGAGPGPRSCEDLQFSIFLRP